MRSPLLPQSGRFPNRHAAGVALGQAVRQLCIASPSLVLGLPRGGVPVAYEVAVTLGAPLDVMVVRKIGMPGQPELAIGAIAIDGIVVHETRAEAFLPSLPSFGHLAARERRELERRERVYRAGLPPLDLARQHVVLVDDGIATGATMLAAVRAARKLRAAAVVVAAPVTSPEAAARLAAEADDVVFLQTPRQLRAIGEWYDDFPQLEDIEVCELLARARHRHAAHRSAG